MGAISRVVLHLDMDAFYAAIEVRENPSLAGLPLIVGHAGRRGVVATCSYEARRYGVRSAMPSVVAARLCPDAVWVSGRMDLYVEESRKIRRILDRASPVVEPLSIDEAFLDLSGVVADLDAGRDAAARLKRDIRNERGLIASVGVAPNKFLAKVASDLEKPDGLVVLAEADVPSRLWPLPVERLWGVGPKTAQRLRAGGLDTVATIASVDSRALATLVGDGMAAHLQRLARGEDVRSVVPHRIAKSISEERTYADDVTRPDQQDRILLERSEGVARALRAHGFVARTVHLKVRIADFTTWTRSLTLREPTDLAETIVKAAREMFLHRVPLRGRGVRLLGVGVSGIEPASSVPGKLFPDPDEVQARRRARAVDAVRARLGDDAVTRARLLRKGKAEGTSPPEASTLPSVD